MTQYTNTHSWTKVSQNNTGLYMQYIDIFYPITLKKCCGVLLNVLHNLLLNEPMVWNTLPCRSYYHENLESRSTWRWESWGVLEVVLLLALRPDRQWSTRHLVLWFYRLKCLLQSLHMRRIGYCACGPLLKDSALTDDLVVLVIPQSMILELKGASDVKQPNFPC